MKNRILYSDNGTLTDFTNELYDYASGSAVLSSFVGGEDKIFIGSTLAFNHFYVKLGSTVNANAVDMTIRVWDGNQWQSVVEIQDGTKNGSASFGQSGFVEFVPNKDESWHEDDTVLQGTGEHVTGLGNVTIYDRFWLEITLSGDLTADTTIEWIGQKFSNDVDLGLEFPSLTLTDTLSAIGSGRTDYEDVHIRAAEIIVKELIAKKVIEDRNQLLVREDLMPTSVQKVAELIYNMLGNDYNDDKETARKEYYVRLVDSIPKVDLNADGRIETAERNLNVGMLIR